MIHKLKRRQILATLTPQTMPGPFQNIGHSLGEGT